MACVHEVFPQFGNDFIPKRRSCCKITRQNVLGGYVLPPCTAKTLGHAHLLRIMDIWSVSRPHKRGLLRKFDYIIKAKHLRGGLIFSVFSTMYIHYP